MVDRVIVYPGSIPLDSDILTLQRNTMTALGFLAQAALGTNALLDGLALTAASPASMTVTIGPGSVFQLSSVDSSGFGSLPADTIDPLLKVGTNLTPTTFTLTAPGTAGQSINYLIEATMTEADALPVVLPYYNAASPATPYSGPANSGLAQNTVRTQRVGLQIKAGAAANAGTQATPAVDAGWLGAYVITVNYGQTTITSTNLGPNGLNYLFPGAPFVGTKLPALRQRLTGNLNLYVSPTGNDAATGLSAGTPFATLQQAWNVVITNYDMNGFTATVNVANGTYTQGVFCCGTPVGVIGGVGNAPGQPGPSVLFVGNVATPASCTINVASGNCFYVGNGANVSIKGFTLLAGGTSTNYNALGNGIYAFQDSAVLFGNCAFGVCSSNHLSASSGALIETAGNPYSIIGGAQAHGYAASTGYVTWDSSTITLTGTPAFAFAFAYAQSHGLIAAAQATTTYTGAATGPRYLINMNGVVSVTGGVLPGSTAGSTASGGQYV